MIDDYKVCRTGEEVWSAIEAISENRGNLPYDIDGEIIRAARANAKAAGVDHMIHFQQRPVSELSHPKKYGFIITNPPYGERIEEKKNLPELYRTIGERYQALDSWSAYIITAYEDAERYFGRKADKNSAGTRFRKSQEPDWYLLPGSASARTCP